MENNNSYIKNDNKDFNFDPQFKQSWHHSFNMQGVRPSYVYVKNFMDRRNTQNVDITIELLRFVLNFTFATKEQILNFLEMKGYYTGNVEELLEYFIKSRILNKFALAKEPLQQVPEDAFVCYCLDFGGKHLLSHYGKDDLIEWTSVNAARSVELISKYLSTTNFYLTLLKNKKDDLVYFESFKTFDLKKKNLQVSAVFQIKNNHDKRDFILDVYKGHDIPINVQDKSQRYFELYKSKLIEKYYKIEPVILFLAENDEVALEVSDIFYRFTENKHFRLMTDKRIEKGFTDKSFLKYKVDDEKLIVVKSSMFTK
jgi:hypothetical protein